MHNELSMYADDYSYVIARDATDAARLNAALWTGNPDDATAEDASAFERVRGGAVVARAEEPGQPAVEKTAREWIAAEGRGVFAMEET